MYSDRAGLKVADKKAVYTKTKTGAARFTTLLIPVNIGEEFDVTSRVLENKNDIDDDMLHMSYFKITEKSKGDEIFYYYYHIDDETQIPEEGVRFSNFVTDATTLIIQQNKNDEIISVLITDGSYVKMLDEEGYESDYLFKADEKTTISYTRNGYFVNVEASEYDEASDLKGVQLYMQNIKAARLDGEVVSVDITGNVIEFDGEYGGSNRPSSGGGSGGGGGGGAGGTNPVKPAEPKPEDTKPEDVKPVEPTPFEPEIPSFGDILPIDWFYSYVEELYEKGIVSGDETGKFNPNDNVTREQFLKMLIEAADIESEEGENSFEDVKSDAWYKPYVLKAKNFGIANGVSDIEFGVGSKITRQDMAVMISRTISKLGLEPEEKEVSLFKDNDKVNDYAKESVQFMKSIGLIEGNNNEFRPLDNLTRAEAAKVISELLKILK